MKFLKRKSLAELFNNKFRIQSTRLKYWDYSSNGAYFITVCTKNREHYFGEIVNGKMKLSEIGEIVCDEWVKTKQIRKNIELDEYVVMPNHFHGIIIINTNHFRSRDVARNVSTFMSNISPKSKSLSTIIRSFKSAVSNRCNKNGYHYFQWQPRFYEHIIRNENDMNRICEYIINNPLQW